MLCCLSNHFGTISVTGIYRALWVYYQRWVLAEKYNLYQYLKWERKENRENEISRRWSSITKAQGPIKLNHFIHDHKNGNREWQEMIGGKRQYISQND